MKVLLFANTDWYLYNFRFDFAVSLKNAGYEVVLLSPDGPYQPRFKEAGFRWLEIPLSRRGINPFKEAVHIFQIYKLYRQEMPDIIHHFTIKCVVYGSTAAHLVGIKSIVNSITGLGYVFLASGLKADLLRWLTVIWYRLVLRGTSVVFLNQDDQKFFLEKKIIKPHEAILITGDGVNTETFSMGILEKTKEPLVVLVCRMLYDKGVGEYVEAARRLKQMGVAGRFALVGNVDTGNPAAISRETLEAWQKEGVVEWWGWHDNMTEVYQQAHIACLPSYREGLPKMLIEAGACGLPLVATDVPGCREVVVDGENGFLVKARDVDSLVDALQKLLLDESLRKTMGESSRDIVEKRFSTRAIVDKTMSVYQELAQNKDE